MVWSSPWGVGIKGEIRPMVARQESYTSNKELDIWDLMWSTFRFYRGENHIIFYDIIPDLCCNNCKENSINIEICRQPSENCQGAEMAGCLLRHRDLRTKQENMDSKTRVSSSRAPSHSPQDETNKEVPRVAARAGQPSGSPDKLVVSGHSWDQAQSSVCWSHLGSMKAWL